MFKLLAVLVIVLSVAISFAYWIFFAQNKKPVIQIPKIQSRTQLQEVPLDIPLAERMALLEEEVKELSSKSTQQGAGGGGDPSFSARIEVLENTVAKLQAEITKLKPSQQSSANQTKTPPAYIPLGASGASGDKNFASLSSHQVSIDTNDYPGYTNAQLEITLKLSESVGTANARLYNSTDSLPVSGSDISTTANTYTLLTSSTFKLSPGKKTYNLQVQSTQGYEISIQSARIRVNF